jgi:hypothetical protein
MIPGRINVTMKTPGWVTSSLSLDTVPNTSGIHEAVRMCVCHVAIMSAKKAGIADPITWLWSDPAQANLRAMIDSIKVEGSMLRMVQDDHGVLTKTWEPTR